MQNSLVYIPLNCSQLPATLLHKLSFIHFSRFLLQISAEMKKKHVFAIKTLIITMCDCVNAYSELNIAYTIHTHIRGPDNLAV